ncbi:hypothetical protein ACNOYE_31360 [Nannocystaceae bacterium ST9]
MQASILLACEPQAATATELPLPSNELRFVAHGLSGIGFHSTARGRISLLALDEPPVVIGMLELERMQLVSEGRVVVEAETGTWPFVAHPSERGTIASVRLAPSMPGEAAQLLRFAMSELRPATLDGLGRDEVQIGLVDVWQASVALLGVRVVLCLRSSSASGPARSDGVTLSLHDPYGPWLLASIATTRVELPSTPLRTFNVLIARRDRVAAIAPDDPELVANLEQLSAVQSVSLADAMPSPERLDELRREAESWPDLVARIRSGEIESGTVVTRIAAHLRADDEHVDELVALLEELEPGETTVGRVLAALGECGTPPCQAALVERLDAAQHETLAVLARVDEPTSDTLDAVLARASAGDAQTRELVGMLLNRHAQHDPDDALARARSLISPSESCSMDIDAWLGLLGNAGLAGSEAWLLDCLGSEQYSQRRAPVIGALRRIPGSAVTSALVDHVRDADEAVRDASLRALVRREASEEQLSPLAELDIATWPASSLHLLVDLLEAARPSSSPLRELVGRLAGVVEPDVAERAQELLGSLDLAG